MDIYVDDYKEISDELDTNAINRAIAIAKEDDRVVFKNRLYISGTIKLKSNLNIYFKDGAHLKACDDLSCFSNGVIFNDKLDVNTFINCDYDGMPKLFFIYGKDIENVKISGNGIIDGNEKIFYGEITPDYIEGAFYPRMPLFYIENAKNLFIGNVTLTKSAFWTLHLVGCDGVSIDNIKVLNNRTMLNADGIDPDHSKNILIENSYIESADDCIAIKNTEHFAKYGDTHNIVVRNCIFKSTSAALKIGTETCGDFNDIIFEDIKILDSNRAIAIQLRDFGNIRNVKFNDIDIETHMFNHKAFWGKGDAIAITSVRRNDKTILGKIEGLEFNNIKAKSEHGIFLYGNMENLSFNNVEINLYDETNYDKRIYDLRPTEDLKLIDTDPVAIYSKHAKNIKFKNFKHNNFYDLLNKDNDSNIYFE